MVGNQTFINVQILSHEDNPIKEPINGVKPDDIIHIITHEAWKQWRKELTHSEAPHIVYPGLGYFSMMHGKAKNFLRKLLGKIRWYKVKFADSYQTEGTRGHAIYTNTLLAFKETWKQVNNVKIETNNRIAHWNRNKQKYNEPTE